MRKTLKIYKASAGSGKTFTLALEYIKLLVQNPYSYRNILAVTFTNKATAEMKERILGKLYGVANCSKSAKEYMEKVKQQMPHMSEELIRERARMAFGLIMHDYGHFRIQTIDAFFQTVLRGLAKELELSGDMEIAIEKKEYLENAVDTYIRELDPEKKEIEQVVRYIDEQLESGNDWNVDKAIKSFANNILEEEYQERGEQLRKEIDQDGGKLFEEFRSSVRRLRDEAKEELKDIGKEFFVLNEGRRIDDFSGKSNGAWPFFEKLRDGKMPNVGKTIKAMMDDANRISKIGECCEVTAPLFDRYKAVIKKYTSCELALKHIHQLGLLNSIARTLKEENTRENRFMLAETTHLLTTLIKENTTFIFEKIGTEIEHIFIDEFQDTSKLQWQCFEVLLKEILARGNYNLIVGDVKQAIYRWRNGDWKIMNNLASYFKEFGDTLEFESQETIIDGKKFKSVNYRSDRRIISFNNALYHSAIKVIESTFSDDLGKSMLNEITSAYDDVEQAYPLPAPGKSPKPEQGYAEVRIIERVKKTKDKEFDAIVLGNLMSTLHLLLEEKGVKPKDIAILVRTNRHIEKIVDAFKAEFPNLKIVSDEAYRLSSSLTVSLAIAAMRYIATPEDKINIANLLNLYNKVILKNDTPLEGYLSQGELIELLPERFRCDLEHMKGLPTYELIERLMSILNIESSKGEEAYIYAFLDHMSQYINSKSADLNAVLNAWDEGLCDKCIPAESDDSIKAMTIHKSKGLEFHTVIMPFCDWKLTADERSLLWCEPQVEPFNKLSLLPVKSKSEMKESYFAKDYNEEFLYQIVDNLNIIYVATTRAKSNLFIFTENKETETYPVWKLINHAVVDIAQSNALPGMTETDEELLKIYRYGEIVASKGEDKGKDAGSEACDNPFESESVPQRTPLTFHDNRLEVKQSRELTRFLASEEEKKVLKNIAEGELMHMVMQEIETAHDIDKALDKLMLQGVIEDASRHKRIKELVGRALSNQKAAEWFNGRYRLYNECTILSRRKNQARRPDRVMIKGDEAVVVDYKFGREKESYEEQVKEYMELLEEMGYRNVTGYLWYVYKNEIKPVTL